MRKIKKIKINELQIRETPQILRHKQYEKKIRKRDAMQMVTITTEHTILIADKIDLKTNIRDKEGYFIMIKELIH